jgi:hypothetical protein
MVQSEHLESAIVTDRLFPKKKAVSVLIELFKNLEALSKIKGIIQKVLIQHHMPLLSQPVFPDIISRKSNLVRWSL